MRSDRLSAKRRPNARNTLPAESASDPLFDSMPKALSAVSPNAASADRQISPCCPEVTTRTKKSSPLSRSAFTTGASLIASGRVPTMISQRNARGSFERMLCMRRLKRALYLTKNSYDRFDSRTHNFSQKHFIVKILNVGYWLRSFKKLTYYFKVNCYLCYGLV